MNSQEKRLKEHLKNGKTITRLEALNTLGIFELSSRIVALEKEGVIVERKWIEVTNRWGEKVRIKKYWVNDLNTIK